MKEKRANSRRSPGNRRSKRLLALARVLLLKDDIPVIRLVENTTNSIKAVFTAFTTNRPEAIDDVLHVELETALALWGKDR